jgi:hypothetical protein
VAALCKHRVAGCWYSSKDSHYSSETLLKHPAAVHSQQQHPQLRATIAISTHECILAGIITTSNDDDKELWQLNKHHL